jgi:hypothetical protein
VYRFPELTFLRIAETILANQPDFLEQKCSIAEIIEKAGDLCLFLPKYHCELNIIEFFWGATKCYTRGKYPWLPPLHLLIFTHSLRITENCDYSLAGLEVNRPLGQAAVKIETIRRWYHRMMRWLDAHELGEGAVQAGESVRKFKSKTYTSHRRIGDVDDAPE